MTSVAASVRSAMPDHSTPSHPPTGDPWHAFGFIVSGVLLYGLLGGAADHWLGTSWLVVVGILFGAGMGIYMTWARFNKPYSGQSHTAQADLARPHVAEKDTGDIR